MKGKFHVNSKGEVRPCKATKDNCPFGGEDFHFDTAEQAQKYADLNNAIYAKNMKASFDSENKKFYCGKYSFSGYRHIANRLENLSHNLNNIINNFKIQYQMEDTQLSEQEYINQQMGENKNFSNIRKYFIECYGEAQRFSGERNIFEQFADKFSYEDIYHINYSEKSSSAYIYIDSSLFNDAKDELEKLGCNIIERPDSEKYLGQYFSIRFANHQPNGYDEDFPDKYWLEDKKPTLLVQYPDNVELENNNSIIDLMNILYNKSNERPNKKEINRQKFISN